MKKLSTVLSLLLVVGLFHQGLAFAEAKMNFTPKKKHAMAQAAPAAEASNPVAAVMAPVAEVVTPVAEATGQVVEGVTAPVVGAVDAMTPDSTASTT